MQIKAPDVLVYDPKRLVVSFDGKKLEGCLPYEPVTLNRGLNSVASATVFLSAHSEWVLPLKKALGHTCYMEVDYTSDSILSTNLCFKANMTVAGYTVEYRDSLPVFAFHFLCREF